MHFSLVKILKYNLTMFEFDDDAIKRMKWIGIGVVAGYVLRGWLSSGKSRKQQPCQNTLYLIDKTSSGVWDYFADEENNYENLYRQLNAIPDNEPVNIVIKTYGGPLTWCLKICETIKNRSGTTRVYVAEYAYSAGTIIALAADELYMAKNSTLSAIDPQYNVLSFTQVALKTIPQLLKPLEESKSHMKESFEKELEHYKSQITKYINKYYNVENIIDKMLLSSVTHEQIYFIDELKTIGITIQDWDGKLSSIAENENKVI
jgi:ATP-dependent protease ClpP protease subunit